MAAIQFSGLASGIDSSALIQTLIDQQRQARIVPLQNKISKYQDTNSAFDELKTLLGNLNSAASKFRELNGGSLSKLASSSDESVVTAVAGSSASNGTYTINVSKLAKNATHSFNDRYSSSDAVINSGINDGASALDRSVKYTIGTGADAEVVNIELTSSTTLEEFVSEFNANSTKAVASVVNVGTSSSPSYAVVVNSLNTGTEEGQVTASVGSEITGNGSFTAATVDQATNASFTVSGISGTITRDSNSVGDVIPGVTLDLSKTGSATITIGDDAEATTATIQDFVDAYNEVVNFIKENDLVVREEDSGEPTNVFGALASTSLDENLISSLRSAFSSASISGGEVNTLSDLGIATQRDGTLLFDTDAFATALSKDPEAVRTITANLGETLSATGTGTITQYTQFGGLIDSATNANKTDISRLQSQISNYETLISKREQSYIAQFARLEQLVGGLNQQQQALASLFTA